MSNFLPWLQLCVSFDLSIARRKTLCAASIVVSSIAIFVTPFARVHTRRHTASDATTQQKEGNEQYDEELSEQSKQIAKAILLFVITTMPSWPTFPISVFVAKEISVQTFQQWTAYTSPIFFQIAVFRFSFWAWNYFSYKFSFLNKNFEESLEKPKIINHNLFFETIYKWDSYVKSVNFPIRMDNFCANHRKGKPNSSKNSYS